MKELLLIFVALSGWLLVVNSRRTTELENARTALVYAEQEVAKLKVLDASTLKRQLNSANAQIADLRSKIPSKTWVQERAEAARTRLEL